MRLECRRRTTTGCWRTAKDPNRVYIGLEEAYTGEYHGPTASNVPLGTSFTAMEKYANACGFLTYFNTIPNNNGIPCPSILPEYGKGTTHPDQHSAAIAVTSHGERFYSGNDGGWWAQNAHTVTDTTGAGYQGFDNASWTSLNAPATVLPWDVTHAAGRHLSAGAAGQRCRARDEERQRLSGVWR